MSSRVRRRRTHSERSIRDPPGYISSEICRRGRRTSCGNRRSSSRAEVTPDAPPAATKRGEWGIRGADDDVATLCTSMCTPEPEEPEESSLPCARELKDWGDVGSPIAAIATATATTTAAAAAAATATAAATASDRGLHAVENEDGYDAAAKRSEAMYWASHNAAISNAISFASSLKQRCDQPLDQQEDIQQIVNKILLEQAIARDAWNEVAEEYHCRVEPFTSSFVPHLLDSTCLASSLNNECHYLKGMSVLDVAAGTGAGALYAASQGATSVMATDFSENMLRVLQSRIDEGNIDQVETYLANGLCLPLGWTDRYDVVLSNFGVIYFPKVQEGILEMVRCAKPGGKVCVSGWGPKEESPVFGIFPAAIKLCGLDHRWRAAQRVARTKLLAATGNRQRRKRRNCGLAPNYFCPSPRMSSSGSSLRAMFADAGLVDVQVISVEKELEVDGDGYWDRFVRASPNLKRFIEHCVCPGEVQQLRETVSQLVHKESPNPQQGGKDDIVLKASAYLIIGTK